MAIYWVDVTHKTSGRKGTVHCIAKNAKHVKRIMRDTVYRVRDYGQCSGASLLRLFGQGEQFFYCELSRGAKPSYMAYETAQALREGALDNNHPHGRLFIND